MKTMIRGAAVALAAVGLTAATALPSTSAPSDESRRVYYGAIAMNTRTLDVGYINDYGSSTLAKQYALNRCKKNTQYSSNDGYCKNIVAVRNGCAAVAVKYDSKNRPVRYGYGTDFAKWPAVREAKRQAQGSSSAGTVKTRIYLCTTRYY